MIAPHPSRIASQQTLSPALKSNRSPSPFFALPVTLGGKTPQPCALALGSFSPPLTCRAVAAMNFSNEPPGLRREMLQVIGSFIELRQVSPVNGATAPRHAGRFALYPGVSWGRALLKGAFRAWGVAPSKSENACVCAECVLHRPTSFQGIKLGLGAWRLVYCVTAFQHVIKVLKSQFIAAGEAGECEQ